VEIFLREVVGVSEAELQALQAELAQKRIQAVPELDMDKKLAEARTQISDFYAHDFVSRYSEISEALAKGGKVELRNFGIFEMRWRSARQARNPRTGEKVMVPKRCTVTFKPGQAVEERVQSESQTAAVSPS